MAIFNCPECNKEVSDTALNCPHCGYQLNRQESATPSPTSRVKKTGCVKATLIALLVIASAIGLVKLIEIIVFPTEHTESSTPNKVVSQYVKQYAGGYTIEVRGYSGLDVEAYALSGDGTAVWMSIEPDASGTPRQTQRKTGTWNATETTITVKIHGNTGLIEENYTLQKGVFVNTLSKDRYLKPSK